MAKVKLVCRWCGSEFQRHQSELRKAKKHKTLYGVFCSKSCDYVYRRSICKCYPKIGTRHAHRVVAEQKLGRPLNSGEIVHHQDENIANFSPDNLVVLDSASEHALLHGFGKITGNAKRRLGSRNSRAKLTEADVDYIRASAAPHVSLADRFGVSYMTIIRVRRRHNWTHV